ncbi:MAG: hypothetical protein A4E72_01783 [Syntrophus sp. PtaU1.Bin208]|nr:MAG: hypothetical protein A4E72_01783 [Syntrophus sp. PtaU1.Bin208]
MERYGDQEVTVAYDDDRASLPQMMELLKEGKYPVSGKPVIVE